MWDCGTTWHAMFSKDHNFPNSACAEPAYARLWIAGGVAAVGMGVAFWSAGRRRLSAMVGYALLATVLVRLLALVASSSFGGGA
jgi:ABC-type transport system involved in cytochrome c biogenesis permease subunit